MLGMFAVQRGARLASLSTAAGGVCVKGGLDISQELGVLPGVLLRLLSHDETGVGAGSAAREGRRRSHTGAVGWLPRGTAA